MRLNLATIAINEFQNVQTVNKSCERDLFIRARGKIESQNCVFSRMIYRTADRDSRAKEKKKERSAAINLTRAAIIFFYPGQVEEFELSRKDGGQHEVTRVVVARLFLAC